MAAPRVIVGGGAAGLSLALALDEPVEIIERADHVGGLCRSFCVDGFTFDTGPHILGGIPDAVRWVIDSTRLSFVEGRTRNVGWHRGAFVAHPFDDPDVGRAYMAKMWKTPVHELALPGLGAQPGRRPGGVATFLYPLRGGYQAITDVWAARLNDSIVCGVTAEPEDGQVWTAPGAGRYNTLATVTLGFEGIAPDLTAVYLPEPWTPFHRLSFPSAFAPANAPAGCFTIQGEATFAAETWPFPSDLVGHLEATVGALGFGGRPVFQHVAETPHAYPVPLAGASPEPRVPDAIRHGRTGAHRYLNLDGVVAASCALAARLNERAA